MGNYYYQCQAVHRWEGAVSSAQQVLQSQQRRFNAGDINIGELLEAQRQLAESLYALAVAQGNAFNTMVDVTKSLGGGMSS